MFVSIIHTHTHTYHQIQFVRRSHQLSSDNLLCNANVLLTERENLKAPVDDLENWRGGVNGVCSKSTCLDLIIGKCTGKLYLGITKTHSNSRICILLSLTLKQANKHLQKLCNLHSVCQQTIYLSSEVVKNSSPPC